MWPCVNIPVNGHYSSDWIARGVALQMNILELVGKDIRGIILSFLDLPALSALSRCSKSCFSECLPTLNAYARERLSGEYLMNKQRRTVISVLFDSRTTGRLFGIVCLRFSLKCGTVWWCRPRIGVDVEWGDTIVVRDNTARLI